MIKKWAVLFLALAALSGLVRSGSAAEKKVGALGRIQPAQGIVRIGHPEGGTIAAIYVEEGDVVEAHTPLVLMESKTTFEQDVLMAETDLDAADRMGAMAVAVQELKLEEARTKGRASVAMQKLEVLKAESHHTFMANRVKSLESIGGESFSKQQARQREYELEQARLDLQLARQKLDRLEAELHMAVSVAERERQRLVQKRRTDMAKARSTLDVARSNVDRATVRAPSNGTILEVFHRPGDKTAGEAILTMADLSQMAVIAQVFEGDLLKLSLGMKAVITSKSLPSDLTGKVVSISRMISENSKVADVKILLDRADIASNLINLEVDVSIGL